MSVWMQVCICTSVNTADRRQPYYIPKPALDYSNWIPILIPYNLTLQWMIVVTIASLYVFFI